jgi:hypothetical protein
MKAAECKERVGFGVLGALAAWLDWLDFALLRVLRGSTKK